MDRQAGGTGFQFSSTMAEKAKKLVTNEDVKNFLNLQEQLEELRDTCQEYLVWRFLDLSTLPEDVWNTPNNYTIDAT